MSYLTQPSIDFVIHSAVRSGNSNSTDIKEYANSTSTQSYMTYKGCYISFEEIAQSIQRLFEAGKIHYTPARGYHILEIKSPDGFKTMDVSELSKTNIDKVRIFSALTSGKWVTVGDLNIPITGICNRQQTMLYINQMVASGDVFTGFDAVKITDKGVRTARAMGLKPDKMP